MSRVLAGAAASPPGRGLTSRQAQTRRLQDGPNRVQVPHGRPLRRLLAALGQPPAVILVVTGVVFGLLHDARGAAAALVLGIALLAFEVLQGTRSVRSLLTLARLSAPRALCWRDGHLSELPAEDLVRDDLIQISAGDRVPADARLVEADRLVLDESLVTGESQPVEYGPIVGPEAALKAGTRVVKGRGLAVVTAVGMRSALGRVAGLAQHAEAREAMLQRQVAAALRWLSMGVVGAVAVAAATGWADHQTLAQVLPRELTLAVAAVPAAVPLLVAAMLGLGSRTLSHRGAVLRQVRPLEALATMTLLCTDKTGTMTENRIRLVGVLTASRVLEVASPSDRDAERVKRIAKLASEPPIAADSELGDPMDLAIARESAWQWPAPLARFGFDGGRRLASALAADGDGALLGVKGAPEAVLVRANRWRSGSGTQVPLDGEERTRALATARQLAAGGARILAVASRPVETTVTGPSELERELVFEGFLAFGDTLRTDVPTAIRALLRDRVSITVVTGDGAPTAESAARLAGLGGPVFIAAQTRGWSAAELGERAGRGFVLARARPEDKLRVVRAAIARGEVVAVTGDGVNDVPALRAAAIGVAVGDGASDLAREAADLVLGGSGFGTLAAAAIEARRLYDNLRKAIRYVVAAGLALTAVELAAVVGGRPPPFDPPYLLALEVLTIVAVSLTYVLQPSEGDELGRHQRGLAPPLFGRRSLLTVGAAALTMGLLPGGAYLAGLMSLGLDVPAARSLALACWLVAQAGVGVILAWRHRLPTLRAMVGSPASLVWLAVALAAGAVVALAPRLLPAAAGPLGLGPLPVEVGLVGVGASLIAPCWLEAARRIRHRVGI